MKKMHRMRDELRKTFLIYALLPMLLLFMVSAGLMYAYWSQNIASRNQAALDDVARVLEDTLSEGLNTADRLAVQCDISRLETDELYRVDFYRKLYSFLNEQPDYSMFLVLDAEQRIVLSSRSQTPEFLRRSQNDFWGVLPRLQSEPQHAMYEFTGGGAGFGQPRDIVIGRAVMDHSGVRGYLVFVVSGSTLLQELVTSRANIIVEDAFGHTPLCTDYNFSQRLNNKLRPEFHQAEGYVHYSGADYYVGRRSLAAEDLTVYAITPLGELQTYLEQAGIVLGVVVIILLCFLLFSSQAMAREQTQMIEQLVDAFRAAKQGDLDYRFNIPASSELSVVGEAYNRMAVSLSELIASNAQKTREAVILELEQLTSQFDPHFLYNTLSSIRFMITLQPQAAQEMTLALSRLLRYSIKNAVAVVPLGEDMEYIYDYLDIMSYRFDGRFDYSIDLPPKANQILVPKLVLQPLLENALKYGLEAKLHLEIKIKGSLTDEGLTIYLQDNGSGIAPETLAVLQESLTHNEPPAGHTGLYNVHRRIRLLCGDDYGLEIESEQGRGTRITVRLPNMGGKANEGQAEKFA